MKEKVNFIKNINKDNKEAYLEFFFTLLQEIEKEIFKENIYTNIDNFGIHLVKEITCQKIYIFSKKLSKKYEMMGSVPEEHATFVISFYNNECIKFEVELDSLRSDLKDHYVSFTPHLKVKHCDYKILFTYQEDTNVINLCKYYCELNNNNNILEIKRIEIIEKEDKILVDILFIIEKNFIWLSDTIKELNLDENILVFDKAEFKNKRITCLSDFLDDKSLFLIEARYI